MEVEQIQTLMTVKGVEQYGWDALHELLFARLVVGPPGIDRHIPVSLTRAGAEQLIAALQQCLSEANTANMPVQ